MFISCAELPNYDLYFSGFVPKWLAEMITVTLGGAVMYSIYRLMDALDVTDESVVSIRAAACDLDFGSGSVSFPAAAGR